MPPDSERWAQRIKFIRGVQRELRRELEDSSSVYILLMILESQLNGRFPTVSEVVYNDMIPERTSRRVIGRLRDAGYILDIRGGDVDRRTTHLRLDRQKMLNLLSTIERSWDDSAPFLPANLASDTGSRQPSGDVYQKQSRGSDCIEH